MLRGAVEEGVGEIAELNSGHCECGDSATLFCVGDEFFAAGETDVSVSGGYFSGIIVVAHVTSEYSVYPSQNETGTEDFPKLIRRPMRQRTIFILLFLGVSRLEKGFLESILALVFWS